MVEMIEGDLAYALADRFVERHSGTTKNDDENTHAAYLAGYAIGMLKGAKLEKRRAEQHSADQI